MKGSIRNNLLVITMSLVTAKPILGAEPRADWYNDQSFRHSSISKVACDVIRSPFTKWIKGGLHIDGQLSQGKGYATLTAREVLAITGSAPNGQMVAESYDLNLDDSSNLSRIFAENSCKDIPFYVQVASSMPKITNWVGLGMTLVDYLLIQNPKNKIDNAALAEIVKHGGKLTRIVSVLMDNDKRPWVGQHIVLETKINDKPTSYVLCSALFALKVE